MSFFDFLCFLQNVQHFNTLIKHRESSFAFFFIEAVVLIVDEDSSCALSLINDFTISTEKLFLLLMLEYEYLYMMFQSRALHP